jgi:hypothetical protein
MDTSLTIALIGGAVALAGQAVAYYFARWRDVRLKEFEIKLKYYQDFLNSFSEYARQATFETQHRFTETVNLMHLMASEAVLGSINKLVNNYNDPDGTADKQWPILNEIIYNMRIDLGGSNRTPSFLGGTKVKPSFQFPMIIPDIENDDQTSDAEQSLPKANRRRSPQKQH